MANSDKLDALINSNSNLQTHIANNQNTNSQLDTELEHAQNTLDEHNLNKVNLERLVEIKTYYSLKYKAINNLVKIFFVMIIVLYIILVFFGTSNRFANIFMVLVLGVGLYYLIHSYHDITLRDKRNFEEYDFGKPGKPKEKTPSPKKICIKTDCDDQGDTYNKQKNDTIDKTTSNMYDDN
tara:strand:- start:183 stop:725 length:543 start_codon:yes stop_codon:yes gene_type:complete